MKKLLSMVLALVIVLSVASCALAEAPVTIRVFTNLPDRTTGQGLVEQIIFDQYMTENPHITIEVEALHDEAYKTKFKAYASGTEMPDLVSVWGQPGFISEVIEAGLLAELDEAAYADYGFIEGSLTGFKGKDGKLFGLPRNTDVMGIYYNKALFDANGWTVPTTFAELVELCKAVRAVGLEPISVDGADKWPVGLFYHNMLMKQFGTNLVDIYANAIENKAFAQDPTFLDMAKLYQANAADLFQVGFETQDYGTSMNLFTNGMSAMYFMGSWEMSLANNENIAPEVRDNIRVFTMPVIDGGKGAATDIAAWNGGGHSVTASGAQKEEAIKLLNFMYLPDNWTRLAWENNVCMSAQDFAKYQTGSETPVQLEFIDYVQNSTNLSGTPLCDSGNAEFKTRGEDASQELSASMITPEEFISKLDQ